MPQITIIASRTRGDVQPYVALGQGLRAAGHHVRLLSSDDFADMTQAIHQTVVDQRMRERAAALGEKIRTEDGISRAVDLIGEAYRAMTA